MPFALTIQPSVGDVPKAVSPFSHCGMMSSALRPDWPSCGEPVSLRHRESRNGQCRSGSFSNMRRRRYPTFNDCVA